MKKLSKESKEYLTDPDFERAIRKIAMDLGAEATLMDVKHHIDIMKPPVTKSINGFSYTAGYAGPNMVPYGWRYMELVEIFEEKSRIKLMFATKDNYFLYHNVSKENMSIGTVVQAARNMGKYVACKVFHSVVENTGDYHAGIAEVNWGDKEELTDAAAV